MSICVICGKREATTYDHVPPAGIFPRPRPDNLVTVPACEQCNHGASADDENFRVLVSLYCGQFNPESSTLIDLLAMPTLGHNQKLNRELINNMQPTDRATSSDIIYERGWSTEWDMASTYRVIERTVRGLYFHHFEQILGEETECKTSRLDDDNLDTIISSGLFSNSSKNHIGNNNEVVYMCAQQRDEPLNSIWIFEFYGVLWFFCHTIPHNSKKKYEIVYK